MWSYSNVVGDKFVSHTRIGILHERSGDIQPHGLCLQ